MAVRTIRKGVRAVKRFYGLGRYGETQPMLSRPGNYFSPRTGRRTPIRRGTTAGTNRWVSRVSKARTMARSVKRAHEARRWITFTGATAGASGYAIYRRKKKKR